MPGQPPQHGGLAHTIAAEQARDPPALRPDMGAAQNVAGAIIEVDIRGFEHGSASQINFDDPRVGLNGIHCALGDHAAFVQHRDDTIEITDEFHIVLDNNQ